MTRLRVVGRRTPRGSMLPGRAQAAMDVLTADGPVSHTQLQAFLNAAEYAEHAPAALREFIAAEGDCQDAVDPEEWYPLQDEAWAPLHHPRRAQMRELAATMCWGCPVRGACLALALATGEAAGIWGGLGSQDRAELGPAWRTLRALLTAGEESAPPDEPGGATATTAVAS